MIKIINSKYSKESLIVSNAKRIAECHDGKTIVYFSGGTFEITNFWIDINFSEFLEFLEDSTKTSIETNYKIHNE